jgi:hypothetical protein|tara:strand:- start:95 stop:283 length:189 start_codon:yes stop_codon:yes gene_type:complete
MAQELFYRDKDGKIKDDGLYDLDDPSQDKLLNKIVRKNMKKRGVDQAIIDELYPKKNSKKKI